MVPIRSQSNCCTHALAARWLPSRTHDSLPTFRFGSGSALQRSNGLSENSMIGHSRRLALENVQCRFGVIETACAVCENWSGNISASTPWQ